MQTCYCGEIQDFYIYYLFRHMSFIGMFELFLKCSMLCINIGVYGYLFSNIFLYVCKTRIKKDMKDIIEDTSKNAMQGIQSCVENAMSQLKTEKFQTNECKESNELHEQSLLNKNNCEGCDGCDKSEGCRECGDECSQYCNTLQNQFVHLKNNQDTTPVEYVYSKKFLEEKSEDNTNSIDYSKSYVLENPSLNKELNITVETVEWIENENKNNSIEKKIN